MSIQFAPFALDKTVVLLRSVPNKVFALSVLPSFEGPAIIKKTAALVKRSGGKVEGNSSRDGYLDVKINFRQAKVIALSPAVCVFDGRAPRRQIAKRHRWLMCDKIPF